MGIKGLLPFLKPITENVGLSSYAGKRIGVDVMCWLHRGAVACAIELVQESESPALIRYFLKMLELFISYNVEVVVVFDGASLPSKARTDEIRKQRRRQAREEAKKLLSQKQISMDDPNLLMKCREAISITSDMIESIMEVCRSLKIEYIVSPYESDAELAFLCRTGYLSAVISEDSDILVYGCPKVIFKLNSSGFGELIDTGFITTAKNTPPTDDDQSLIETSASAKFLAQLQQLDHRMFIDMCVLSGCDYNCETTLKGIGIKTAFDLIVRFRNLDSVFKNISMDPRWRKRLPSKEKFDEIVMDAKKAEFVFLNHIVYDPSQESLLNISESYEPEFRISLTDAFPETDLTTEDLLGVQEATNYQQPAKSGNGTVSARIQRLVETSRVAGLKLTKKIENQSLIRSEVENKTFNIINKQPDYNEVIKQDANTKQEAYNSKLSYEQRLERTLSKLSATRQRDELDIASNENQAFSLEMRTAYIEEKQSTKSNSKKLKTAFKQTTFMEPTAWM